MEGNNVMGEEKKLEGFELSDEEVKVVAGGRVANPITGVSFTCNSCKNVVYFKNTGHSQGGLDNDNGFKCECGTTYNIDFICWSVKDSKRNGVENIDWKW